MHSIYISLIKHGSLSSVDLSCELFTIRITHLQDVLYSYSLTHYGVYTKAHKIAC